MAACRKAHVAVWCTMATQAWKATELATWLSLPKRLRPNSVLAITHKDSLRGSDDADRLMKRLEAEAAPYFGSLALHAASDERLSRLQDQALTSDAPHSITGLPELEGKVLHAVAAVRSRRVAAAVRLLQRVADRLPLTNQESPLLAA